MDIYEVLNYFDRTRYLVSAQNEEQLIELVDQEFLNKLKEITDDEGEYDFLRNSQEERMEYIAYECLMENANEPQIVENNLKGDLDKYYF